MSDVADLLANRPDTVGQVANLPEENLKSCPTLGINSPKPHRHTATTPQQRRFTPPCLRIAPFPVKMANAGGMLAKRAQRDSKHVRRQNNRERHPDFSTRHGTIASIESREDTTMSLFEALIPGVAGILLLVAPDIFVGSTFTGDARKGRLTKLRGIGVVLLLVAALYAALALFRKKF
jgi:hypothetical protein